MNAITQFLFDNGEFFAALTSTGARAGLNGVVGLEVPAGHPLYADMVKLTNAEAIETFVDAQIEAGLIPLNVFARIY